MFTALVDYWNALALVRTREKAAPFRTKVVVQPKSESRSIPEISTVLLRCVRIAQKTILSRNRIKPLDTQLRLGDVSIPGISAFLRKQPVLI